MGSCSSKNTTLLADECISDFFVKKYAEVNILGVTESESFKILVDEFDLKKKLLDYKGLAPKKTFEEQMFDLRKNARDLRKINEYREYFTTHTDSFNRLIWNVFSFYTLAVSLEGFYKMGDTEQIHTCKNGMEIYKTKILQG